MIKNAKRKYDLPVVLKAVKPTGFIMLLFALLLVIQSVFFHTGSITICAPDGITGRQAAATYDLKFGPGGPFGLKGDCGQWSVRIKWPLLVINLLICYILAFLADYGIRKSTRLQRPGRVYFSVIMMIFLATFFMSIATSRVYWGYWFHRPSLPGEIYRIIQVKALIPVDTEKDETGRPVFVVRKFFSLPEMMEWCRSYPYENPNYRILLHLKKNGILPYGTSSNIGNFARLYSQIPEKFMAKAEEGYDESWKLRGLIVDAETTSGERLVLVTVMGKEVSYDHHPVYELLFKGSRSDPSLRFVKGTRYFYDIENYRGLEWYLMWGIFSFFGILAGLPLFTIGILLWRGRDHFQRA